jgi:hypothetical protein
MPDASWALPNGLPSFHLAHAALHAGAIVGAGGSRTPDAHESHWHHATGGIFAPHDLRRGEQLLLDVGLLTEIDGTLAPTSVLTEMLTGSVEDALATLAAHALASTQSSLLPTAWDDDLAALVPDPVRREQLLLGLGRRFDDAHRRLVGDIGETMVTMAARDELVAMGHNNLARAVRRVSLISDQLGYDISAPRVGGAARLLEVKASSVEASGGMICVHLSRNERDAGASLPGWSLVICIVDDVARRRGHIVGWCPESALEDLLPIDSSSGEWVTAAILVPVDRLVPGLPSPVA